MNKKEKLIKLKKFLELQAAIWIAERDALAKGEKVSIMVSITGGRARRSKILREKLTEDDWKKVASIAWIEPRQKILNLFRETDGVALSMEEISDKLELFRTDGCYIDGINSIFRKEGLPYRIMTFSKWGQFYPQKPQKLVVTDRNVA